MCQIFDKLWGFFLFKHEFPVVYGECETHCTEGHLLYGTKGRRVCKACGD